MTLLLARSSPARSRVLLAGIEVDNLLAFLALLGMLRSLEEREPTWRPRVVWEPRPWRAWLELDAKVDEGAIASAVAAGLLAAIGRLEQHRPLDENNEPLADVSFELEEYRRYAARAREHTPGPGRSDTSPAQLASCLSCEAPLKKGDDRPIAGPHVMMFGQGHQHFLSRYFDVPRAPAEKGQGPVPGDLRAAIATKIHGALFTPWRRTDESQGFRWDPEDDQRYALRFGNPSKAGAANTEDGANRLATLGFLSFPSFPSFRAATRGVARGRDGVAFLWPVWTTPLSLAGVEALLSHSDLIGGHAERLRSFGVAEIYRARRIPNGKFMNVTRAAPVALSNTSVGERGRRSRS